MRAIVPILAALIAAPPASAQAMKNMPGMPQTATKIGQGVGVITALDRRGGTVSIKHGPIPAIGWPAMTMTFQASPPALLRGLRPGQRIAFTARAKGMTAEVTVIQPK